MGKAVGLLLLFGLLPLLAMSLGIAWVAVAGLSDPSNVLGRWVVGCLSGSLSCCLGCMVCFAITIIREG
jgi:hypothetical protein